MGNQQQSVAENDLKISRFAEPFADRQDFDRAANKLLGGMSVRAELRREPAVQGGVLDFEEDVQYPVHMEAMTYTEAREKLATTIKRVCRDHDPVIIRRKREDSVVMISLEDFEALQETAYLLRSPKNAQRLLGSVRELGRRKGKERKLRE